MKKTLFTLIVITFSIVSSLCSCEKNTIQDQAEKEAREYTRRYCPTPPINCISTDSIVFNRTTETFTYYCTFSEGLDNTDVIAENKKTIEDILHKSVLESTQMKTYVEAGFKFEYACRSKKNPKNILLHTSF